MGKASKAGNQLAGEYLEEKRERERKRDLRRAEQEEELHSLDVKKRILSLEREEVELKNSKVSFDKNMAKFDYYVAGKKFFDLKFALLIRQRGNEHQKP